MSCMRVDTDSYRDLCSEHSDLTKSLSALRVTLFVDTLEGSLPLCRALWVNIDHMCVCTPLALVIL